MKRLIVFLGMLFISLGVFANEPATIEEGKQYITLQKFGSPEKEVIEFFSFNCSSCFRFDTEFKATEVIANNLPENVQLKKYHLYNFGPLAAELSEAWSIANVLDMQNEVANALYTGIQKTRTIKSADDIRNVFINLGVSGDEFDKMKTNFLVQAFMAQQRTAIDDLKPASIPAFIVNGKYYVNPRGLDQSSNDVTISDYSRVINHLVDLNNDK